MTQDASFPSSLAQEARRLAPRTWLLGVAALCLGLVTVLVPDGPLRLLPAGLALTLVFLAFGIHALSLGHGRRLAALHRAMERLVEHDAAPCFTTDADGRIEFQNQAALERFGRHDGASFLRALGALFASPAAVVYRLQQRAE
ncbi:MAG: hybrid sensor histidine kinase/response regulator, partial [Tranquillimonas sp.]